MSSFQKSFDELIDALDTKTAGGPRRLSYRSHTDHRAVRECVVIIASFNIENLFAHAKVLDTATSGGGREALAASSGSTARPSAAGTALSTSAPCSTTC